MRNVILVVVVVAAVLEDCSCADINTTNGSIKPKVTIERY